MGVAFPRAPPAAQPGELGDSGTKTTTGSSELGGGDAVGGDFVYNIVLDAGSTGSRIHVFKFEKAGGELKLISDTFEQLKPGLSSFRDEPQKAAESLRPLLEVALGAVPKGQQARTGVSLRATAGLRLLPGGKADDILRVRGLRAGLFSGGCTVIMMGVVLSGCLWGRWQAAWGPIK
jgi:hypothetical protein